MAEKTSVIVGRTIGYEGIFAVKDICSNVDTFFNKRGYTSRTIELNVETVKPSGKFIILKLVFKRYVSEYCRYDVEVKYQFENVTSVEIVKEGMKTKMNKGKASILIDSWVITDYEKSWEIHPTMYFLRTLMNKFFFKSMHKNWEADVKRDVEDVCTEIGSYFNLQQFQK